jgi:hypothetical protein
MAQSDGNLNVRTDDPSHGTKNVTNKRDKQTTENTENLGGNII